MKFKISDSVHHPGIPGKNKIANFLYEHLGKYGDKKTDILKCLDYALKETSVAGGFVITGHEESSPEEIIGAVVINHTGMEGYIPGNVLVYIAVHHKHRGKGYGTKLMDKALSMAKGSVALHVEPENPARFLYEKTGFKSKYLEYRLIR